jgi:hypothetical protein
MSEFITRQYDCHLFLAAPDAENIWNWAQWCKLVPLLTPFMQSPRGRTSIRMTQLPLDLTLSSNPDSIRFGQLGWNSKSHEKWTHGSPQTAGKSEEWEFCCAGIWAPGPGVCEKQDCPPDSYLTIRNEIQSGMTREDCKFAYSLLLAVACDTPHEGLAEIIAACKALTQAVCTLKIRTTWSPEFANSSMTDWDTFGAPYEVGNPHKKSLSTAILLGEWTAC